MQIELSIIIAVIGCAIGLSGWLRNTKNDSASFAEWRGEMKGQLNSIQASVTGIDRRVESLDAKIDKIKERIATVEFSVAQAHKRIDEFSKGEENK